MAEDINVLCDIHKTPMEMVKYEWQIGSDRSVKAFMRCLECTRHYAPLHGYIDIKENQIDPTNRKMRECPEQILEPHYSMAIVGFEGDQPVWKCLHPECRD